MITLSDSPVTETELNQFLADVNARCLSYYQTSFPTVQGNPENRMFYGKQDLKVATIGGKNIAVWCSAEEPFYTGQKPVQGRFTRSIYCFIDRATGDILKPASCKGPVKGARGNIRSEYWDKCLGAYGVLNLR